MKMTLWLFGICGLLAACGGNESPVGAGGSGGGSGGGGTGGGTGSGGNGGGGGMVDPNMVEHAFPKALKEAFCGAAKPCCKGVFDDTLCRINADSLIDGLFDAHFAGVPFNPDAATACIAAAQALASKCNPPLDELTATWATCEAVYPGTRQPGEKCDSTLQCASVPNSLRFCHEYTGKCEANPIQVVVGLGEACDYQLDPLPLGQKNRICDVRTAPYCNAKTHVCDARIEDGKSCKVNPYCVEGDNCFNAVCTPGLTVGDSCSSLCSEGSVCSSNHVCIPIASAGETCDRYASNYSCSTKDGSDCLNDICRTAPESLIWAAACH